MEVFIRNIPYSIDEPQLNRALAFVLHRTPHFHKHMGGAPFNFIVHLFKGKGPRQKQHSGSGVLIVPSSAIGTLFVNLAKTHAIQLHGRALYAEPGKNPVRPEDEAFLREPYQDPALVEKQQLQDEKVKGNVNLQNLQFGWPCQDGSISIEWESPTEHVWALEFDPENRRIRIKSQLGLSVVTALSNVQSTALDSQACVFWLDRPPIFEQEKEDVDQMRAMFDSMMKKPTNSPIRDRLVTLDPTRGNVFGYLRVVRVVFSSQFARRDFIDKAGAIGFTTYEGSHSLLTQGLFDPHILDSFQRWLKELSFDVAFQIDGLVSRCRFNPKELRKAKRAINAAIGQYGGSVVCECIKLLEQLREEEKEHLPADKLFDRTLRDMMRDHTERRSRQPYRSKALFWCHRVTVTPTSLVLSGPFPDETNRVLRRYIDHQSNFVRVEFRDEDRLHIRLDREVDSTKFLQERVGAILHNGLVIAGRRFEYLAYSSSALKEHAVWFICPFDTDAGLVNAESIRASLGDFSGVIKCPARYGARISQAFSTTEASITVEAEEMIRIPDKKSISGSLFTDGVGTMSPEIAREIWQEFTLARSKHGRRSLPPPSTFQIRLGGLKGMLCVDERLEGRVICTRPSMHKFEAPDRMVEIAQAFDRPLFMYLNRPLIMLLETLGVPLDPIMELQRKAVDKTITASKSINTAAELLEQHGLGTSFHMTSILLNLHKLDADLESASREGEFVSFLKRVLKFAVNHVLRDLKYKARIPVPNAWTLVGVADEYDYLKADEIYACVRTRDGEHEYIEGPVLISRSPTVHPGDARMVKAIGKPPYNAPAGLRQLTNCVVFSCKGERSMPSMLAGGDLDGDIYCLILDPKLHPNKMFPPADYESPGLVTIDRPSTASDLAQFVVDFIKNDILGFVATQILLTADISGACMADEDCIKLAALHSDAVDFPKTGRHVSHSQLPPRKNRRKPDWYANETNEQKSKFYESNRHIGHLFRDINLPAIPEAKKVAKRQHRQWEAGNDDVGIEAVRRAFSRNSGMITRIIRRKLREYVKVDDHVASDSEIEEMIDIFYGYSDELSYTCRTHSLAKWTPLSEEEVVAGTIVAKCSQPRMRSDTISTMRRDSSSLVECTREEIEGPEDNDRKAILLRAWTAWKVSVASGALFGARSFGLVVLDVIFNTHRKIDIRAPS